MIVRFRVIKYLISSLVVLLLVFRFGKTRKKYRDGYSQDLSTITSITSVDSVREGIEEALNTQKELILKEMGNYSYNEDQSLSSLLFEESGKPTRNIIFATLRTGSTFLGDVITSHPAMFYHYEPLQQLKLRQVSSGELAQESVELIKLLLNCDYSNTEYVEFGKRQSSRHNQNPRLWQYCKSNRTLCTDANFLSGMCKLFPFQIMKTVRLRLKLAEQLILDQSLDVRILLLIRDPRGVINSRNQLKWCKTDPACIDASTLCSEMVDDYNAAVDLGEEYPEKIKVIRYEDFSLNPKSGSRKMLEFFRLSMHPVVEEFIGNHTRQNKGGTFSTFRDSKSVPFRWIESYKNKSEDLSKIQNQCAEAMSVWGYLPVSVDEDTQIKDLHPLSDPPWNDIMIIPDTDES